MVINRLMLPGCTCGYGAVEAPWVGDPFTQLLWVSSKGTEPGNLPVLVVRPSKSAAVVDTHALGKVVLYLHGNGEDLGLCYPALAELRTELGITLVAPEYPGYGPLPGGGASEESVNARARMALAFVKEVLHVREEDVIVVGRSIGTGSAAALASERESQGGGMGGLVLISPFASVKDLVQDWSVMAAGMVMERWNTRGVVGQLRMPVVLIHGIDDTVIPIRHSKRLEETLTAREGVATSVKYVRAGHNDIHWRSHVAPLVASILAGIPPTQHPAPRCTQIIRGLGFETPPPQAPRTARRGLRSFFSGWVALSLAASSSSGSRRVSAPASPTSPT
eukprot:Hpha_TRINITY_DN16341_c1_g8::TRINITY_DN16341_c1_g8_i1::g.59757::m.59757